MGTIQSKDTHVKRSSSMTFAMRWKHENLRLISLVALSSFAITFMVLVLLYGTATKSVSIVVNGQETVVKTKQWTLQHLLDEQAISVGEHDRLSMSPDSRLKNGNKIIIDRAFPVKLTADGQTNLLYTTGTTVANAVESLKITLEAEDRVEPSLDTLLTADSAIQIIRVKRVIEVREQTVPYKTVTKKDAMLLRGKQQTIQEGIEGVKVKKIEKIYEDGILVSEQEIGESLLAEVINKVVAVGTKSAVTILSSSSPTVEEVTKKGVTFGVKQILKNVTLTAYAAGVDSTGKTKDNPNYGITYTGTRVTEGRTVAVDPKVIPLGWWIYIEGIGFRRAEDIGSAVKGKKVDVYYENEDYANKFGLKRGYTIYVVGPKKPMAN